MKLSLLLHLAAASSAFMIPPQQVFSNIELEADRFADELLDQLPSKSQVSNDLDDTVDRVTVSANDFFGQFAAKAHDVLDTAVDWASSLGEDVRAEAKSAYREAEAWLETSLDEFEESSTFGLDDEADDFEEEEHRPHPPHRRPHPPHRRRPHKLNKTIYEVIKKSKYTTKLAELVDEYPDIVDVLNTTAANFTLFAPTNRAFDKIPKHAPKPSKKFLEKVLLYHLSPAFYPAGRVLGSRTIPTAFKSKELGKKALPQRISTQIGLRGLTANFYARIVAIDIFTTNGVIHGLDSLLVPPPETLELVNILPSEFSTLELGLLKTGLAESLNTTKHEGGTFFAPSNWAFAKLGPRLNGFLFSDYGLKYLKALLQYHVVHGATLYSDAFYNSSSVKEFSEESQRPPRRGPPRGLFHVDLPTLLKGRSLAIDVARYGRLIEVKINAFYRVSVTDGVAADGVIHGLSSVIIPPKQVADGSWQEWDGETELTEEDLIDRLSDLVDE